MKRAQRWKGDTRTAGSMYIIYIYIYIYVCDETW